MAIKAKVVKNTKRLKKSPAYKSLKEEREKLTVPINHELTTEYASVLLCKEKNCLFIADPSLSKSHLTIALDSIQEVKAIDNFLKLSNYENRGKLIKAHSSGEMLHGMDIIFKDGRKITVCFDVTHGALEDEDNKVIEALRTQEKELRKLSSIINRSIPAN